MQSDRRAALLGLAAVPAVLTAKPAEAAYGDAANVFGKSTNTSGAFLSERHVLVAVSLGSTPCWSSTVHASDSVPP